MTNKAETKLQSGSGIGQRKMTNKRKRISSKKPLNPEKIRRLADIFNYTLFAFDLTSDLCSGNHLDLIEKGNLVLEMDFAKSLQSPVSCVMYFEYQQIIEINRERKNIMDYNT